MNDRARDYLALSEAAKRLEMQAAKAEGQLVEAARRAEAEFGCKTPEQLERKIRRMEEELAEADAAIEADLAEFRRRYGKELEDFL